jgi:hypothetical protein
MATQTQSLGSITVATWYTWVGWYSTIVLTNSSANIGLYVRVDGIAAANTGVPGNYYCNAVESQVLMNQLPYPTPGQLIPGTLLEGNLLANNWLAGLGDTVHFTQISVCPVGSGPGTGTISVE